MTFFSSCPLVTEQKDLVHLVLVEPNAKHRTAADPNWLFCYRNGEIQEKGKLVLKGLNSPKVIEYIGQNHKPLWVRGSGLHWELICLR